MINKTLFTQMARKVFRHERGLRDPHIMHPEREWLIGLLVMVLIFVAGAGWSAQIYLKNKNVSADQTTVNDGETVYREPQVKEALRIAGERENELSELLGVAPAAPTPKEDLATTTATTTEEVVIGTEAEVSEATSTDEGE
jgi:hypothetical protein